MTGAQVGLKTSLNPDSFEAITTVWTHVGRPPRSTPASTAVCAPSQVELRFAGCTPPIRTRSSRTMDGFIGGSGSACRRRGAAQNSPRSEQDWSSSRDGVTDAERLRSGWWWAHLVGALRVHPHKHDANYPPQEYRGAT